jgi:hypothetical protein
MSDKPQKPQLSEEDARRYKKVAQFIPSAEQRAVVQEMAAHGISQKEISRLVINPNTDKPIDDETLRLAFRRELDIGATVANNKVVGSLYEQAIAGNTTACIFWAKARLGWRETTRHEFVDQDGNPVGPSLTLVGRPAESEPVAEMPRSTELPPAGTRH